MARLLSGEPMFFYPKVQSQSSPGMSRYRNMGTGLHFSGKRINQAWSVVARTRLRRAAGSVRLHSKADLP
jgi:hypothetical protein